MVEAVKAVKTVETVKTMKTRPQWPHTVEDITKSLDGIWGVVGAKSVSGNLLRLERSLKEPLTYTLTEYDGLNEDKVISKEVYPAEQKILVVDIFASKLGFSHN